MNLFDFGKESIDYVLTSAENLLIEACFLYSFMNSEPEASMFQQFSIIGTYESSLSQAALNLKGLWANPSLGLVSKKMGVWSD